MNTFLIIVAFVCLVVGLIGSVLPALPGVPLSFVGLLILHWTENVEFSSTFLWIWAGITVLTQVADYFIPAWGTKRFGGRRYGVWGTTLGLIVGLFFGPWGIVLGPFVGALVAELIAGKQSGEAVRAAVGSFVGFLLDTLLKVVCCSMMLYYAIEAVA
ncbi:MAG: DUF456 domain-containing protein [Paludibacteraceae bacterium]|nr:DUF456 domain-containing protein [Paludibacteraceae bacterium]